MWEGRGRAGRVVYCVGLCCLVRQGSLAFYQGFAIGPGSRELIFSSSHGSFVLMCRGEWNWLRRGRFM